MPAAAPGTETLSLTHADGTALAVTLHYDPDTGDWADPAITAAGDGGAVLFLDRAALAVQADVPVPAAVLTAIGVAGRGEQLAVALSAAAIGDSSP